MQQNLLGHKNITIQYDTQPVEVKIDESSLHSEDEVYPVEVRLVKTQVESEGASNILENSTPHVRTSNVTSTVSHILLTGLSRPRTGMPKRSKNESEPNTS